MQLSSSLRAHAHDSSVMGPSKVAHTPPALPCTQDKQQLRQACTTAVTILRRHLLFFLLSGILELKVTPAQVIWLSQQRYNLHNSATDISFQRLWVIFWVPRWACRPDFSETLRMQLCPKANDLCSTCKTKPSQPNTQYLKLGQQATQQTKSVVTS